MSPTAPESTASPTKPDNSAGKGKRQSIGDATVGDAAEQAVKEKVISTELRDLLKRDVYYALDKGDVKKHGGGVGS